LVPPLESWLSAGRYLRNRASQWHALDLIEYRALGITRHESRRVVACEVAMIRSLEVHIGQVGEGGATQGGLAGLARAGDGDHRELPRALLHNGHQGAGKNHAVQK
jgi:hypothetical protein